MAQILPRDLTAIPDGTVNPAAAVIVDNGDGVFKATPANVVDSGAPVSSQGEAEAGAVNTGRMTPLRVKQAIDALGVSQHVLESAAGAPMVGWQRSATATVLRTQGEKNDDIINSRDFGAVGDDVADDTAAIQAAMDALQPNQTLVLGNGRFKVSSGLSLSGVDDITIDGSGATIVETTADIVNTLSFTSCDRVNVRGLTFEGVEDYTYFIANTPTEARSFIKLTTCDGGVVTGVAGSDKRRFIELYSCTNCVVSVAAMHGFLQDLSLGAQAEGNNVCTVTFSACSKCVASDIVADHMGSSFLNVQNGSFIAVSNVVGSDMHDNVIYISSGHNVTVTGAVGKDVSGQCVKMRGYNHTVTSSVADGCLGGGISLTGNGTTPDSFGANGHNLVSIGNTVNNCGGDGISIGVQDGLYPRDVTVIGNTVSGGTSSGGFGGVRVTAVRGVNVQGNSVRTMASDYGMLIGGVSAGSKAEEVSVSGNIVGDINGSGASTRGGIRIQNVNGLRADGNIFNDIASGIGVRLNECTDGTCIGNVYDGGAVVRAPTGENISGIVFANNVGSTMLVAGDVNPVMFNRATVSGYASVASTPPAVGTISYLSGTAYLALGTSAATDWAAISNDGRITATAANIASAVATINVTGKFASKLVWDTTNNRMMRANGANATDAWYVVDGSASVTPA